MRIGIQVSSNLKKRTGTEEYVFQLLKHLPMVDDYKNHQFFVYNRENLKWPFKWGWTQIRLSWEVLKNKIDVLFVPAHTFPLIYPVLKYKCGVHPKLVIAIQGLEFEAMPKTYGFIKRKILRFLTKRNAKKSERIIVPSECTKQDLIKFYHRSCGASKINPDKIFVVHHGVEKIENCKLKIENSQRYILYLGSGHKRKNIEGLKKAFMILKERYKIPHKLILAGIKNYISEEKKWELLKNADVFVFPAFYEGFGMPVLEAQAAGVPVVASNTSSLPEILRDSALLVNPNNPEEIAEAIYKIINNQELANGLIKCGYENVQRFSWLKCAEETLKAIRL